MSVSSAVGRIPPNFMILIRASHSLSVSVPSFLNTELWVRKCQCKFGGDVESVGRPRIQHHQVHYGHWPCQQLQVRYTQEWTRVKKQSSGQLIPSFSSLSRALCINRFYRRIVELSSIASERKVLMFTPSPEVVIYPFHAVDKDQITLKISSTHRAAYSAPQLQPFTKMMTRYTSLHIPVWQHRLYHSSVVVRAGHNKWSKVKHKKKFTDLEKSRTIHKYVTLITSATKAGGGSDPDSNIRLAGVIESARKAGVPKANIENAVKNASGKGADSSSSCLVVYDAQGPSGYHLIIETFTENNRKTRPEIKNLLAKYSGILGEPGSSAFMFDHKGVVRVPECEFDASIDLLEVAIEVGAEDVQTDRNSEGTDLRDKSSSNLDSAAAADSDKIGEQQYVRFLCNPSELTVVSKSLKSLGYAVAGASLEYIPKSLIHLSQESYDSAIKLVCALSEHSDVTEVYDNFVLQTGPRK